MTRLVAKHRLAIRWFHWINFPLLGLMIWSGLMIYWANAVYRVGPLKLNPPQRVWDVFHMSYRLADAMAIHFAVMWLFAVNGIVYVAYWIATREWRRSRKYNPTQRVAYIAIVLAGLGSLASGLAIYKPVQLAWLAALFGGYQGARFVHFWLTMAFVFFFVVHVIQVIRAGWNNFRAMVIGVEAVNE